MKILFVVPVPVDDEGVARRAAQLPSDLADAGIEVTFRPVKNGPAWFDTETDLLLADFFCYEAAITAEEEGFDAVCVDTTSDSGIAALRSRLSIPVVGPGEVTYHVAGILGRRFSILTLSKMWEYISWRLLQKAGFEDQCVSVRYLDQVPDLSNLLEGENDVRPALLDRAKQCVEEDGADAIILGSTTMHDAHQFLAENLSVPVINPGLTAFWFAHMLVKTGLKQSPVAFPTPVEPQDDVFRRAAESVRTTIQGH